MKNTFEPFKNNRKSRHPDYQPGGIFQHSVEKNKVLCKNCKGSFGSHIIATNRCTNQTYNSDLFQ